MFRAYLRERRRARRTRGTRQEGSAGGAGEALRRVHRARAGRESRTHLFGNADVGLKLTSSASATGTPRRAPPARSTRTARIARVERIGADAASRDGGVRGAELAKAQRFENGFSQSTKNKNGAALVARRADLLHGAPHIPSRPRHPPFEMIEVILNDRLVRLPSSRHRRGPSIPLPRPSRPRVPDPLVPRAAASPAGEEDPRQVQRGRHHRRPEEARRGADRDAAGEAPHPEVVQHLQGPHHPGGLRDPRRHGPRALLQLRRPRPVAFFLTRSRDARRR